MSFTPNAFRFASATLLSPSAVLKARAALAIKLADTPAIADLSNSCISFRSLTPLTALESVGSIAFKAALKILICMDASGAASVILANMLSVTLVNSAASIDPLVTKRFRLSE